jgi:hypothetical protein
MELLRYKWDKWNRREKKEIKEAREGRKRHTGKGPCPEDG